MRHNNIQFILSNKEANHIRKKLNDIDYDPGGGDDYITSIRLIAYNAFPLRIIKLLEHQRTSLQPLPYLIIDNIPIDDAICGSPSFSQSGKNFKAGNLSENVICALGSLIGEPYSIKFEGSELVNNLTPQKDCKNDYTGLGSEVELDFHIENAALKYMPGHDLSPMGLMLLGVRSDPKSIGPRTFVADCRLAISKLTADDISVLSDNNFIIRLPYRWRSAFNDNTENTNLCPIIAGPDNYPVISAVFYPDMVIAVNDKAKKAFTNLYNALKSVAVGIHITPGKFIYIDNRFSLHSREKFHATYDKNGFSYRWIHRLFVAPNLWGFREFYSVNKRIFDPSSKSVNKLF